MNEQTTKININLLHFWEDTDTKKIVEKEIRPAIERYIRYVWEKKGVKITNQDKPKGPILVLGVEPEFRLNKSWEDSEGYIEKMGKWKFFYELFPENIGYISAPFKPELMIIDLKNCKLHANNLPKNAFKLKDKIKNNINNEEIIYFLEKKWKNLFQELGIYFTSEDLIEKGAIGHDSDEITRFKHQIANFFAGCIYFLKENAKRERQEKKKVLFIDNNPKREMVEIDARFKGILKDDLKINDILENWMKDFLDVFYYKEDFNTLYEKLSEVEKGKDIDIKVEKNGEIKEKNINDFDFILVDIFLGEGEVSGTEIIKLFTSKYPSIPCFALSVADNFDIIRNAIKEGADYYIIKNQIFSILYIYYNYLKNNGELLNFLKKKDDYKKNLNGNIRYWNFKKDLLWFGDKCYHMVEHSYKHTFNDWSYANQILSPLILLKDENEIIGNEELIYSLCMGIWLHDIGHKGCEIYGEPHLIRDNHGYIGGLWVLKYPELFGILDKDPYYKGISFEDISAVEFMLKRKRNGLTIAEKIAIFPLYHKSNTPIDDEDASYMLGKRKKIPGEYYIGFERKRENLITLESIVEKRNESQRENILDLVALFRFIDAIDINEIRVGDLTEKDLKTKIIEEDKNYQLRKMKRETGNISKILDLNEIVAENIFYQQIKEKIEKAEFVKWNIEKTTPEIENYKSLADYAGFISLQGGHFNLHTSIKKIELGFTGMTLRINLFTDKDEETLKKWKVQERGKEEISVYDRLIGKNCYILGEVKGIEKRLAKFFKNIEITLYKGNEILGRQLYRLNE